MKFWTDKQGKELTFKEFISRWKDGINKVTPMQQLKNQMVGYVIVCIGIAWGIIYTFILKQYWLFTILLGSSVITFSQIVGIMQKFIILNNLEKFRMNDALNESEVKI